MKFLLAFVVNAFCTWILFSDDSDEDAAASTPPVISVGMPPGTSQERIKMAETALYEFLKACPEAAKQWVDVTTAENSYWDISDFPSFYQAEAYGWRGYFE